MSGNPDERHLRILDRNLVFIFVAGSLWGLNTAMAAIATRGGFTVFEVAFWQALLALFLLQMAGYLAGERIRPSRRLLWSALACGVLGLTLPNLLFYRAASEVPVGVLSLCIATIPAFTAVMAYFLSIDGLSMKRIMAICVGFLAIIILTAPGFEGQTDPLHYGYLGMALLAAFLYALSFIIMSFFLGECDFPLRFTSLIFGVSALVLAPIVVDANMVTQVGWNAATFGLFAVGPFIAIAHSFYVFALIGGGAIQASFATIIATIMGVLWGMIILGESNSISVWISFVMIIGALNVLRTAPATPQGRGDDDTEESQLTDK